ncbi:MAG: HAMP domain-containing sensor histidine kinase, partial [Candidatus Altiarchaeota archaeon]
MKTEFLAVASHELRTPLSIIMGYADILASENIGGLNSEQRGKLERIVSNAEHLNELVNNILDMAKIDAGELRLARNRFMPKPLIEEVVDDMRQLAKERNIRLVTAAKATPKIVADRSRIKQVLVNLIDNSLKFTPNGGTIHVSAHEKNGQLAVSVSDNGIGIKKNELGNIFQRFYQVDSTIQRKYKGTGLGLAICKRLVELHGGTISVRSALKKGTSMTFTIPFKK